MQKAMEEIIDEKQRVGAVIDDGVIGQEGVSNIAHLADENGDIILDEGEI
jgi:hypothetical protein